jgi:hypothetical protein
LLEADRIETLVGKTICMQTHSALTIMLAAAYAGLDDKGIEGPALLEADQGDTIVGVISRDEAADTVVAALSRPEAAGKTLELRRSEAADAKGKSMSEAAFSRLFFKLALGKLLVLP